MIPSYYRLPRELEILLPMSLRTRSTIAFLALVLLASTTAQAGIVATSANVSTVTPAPFTTGAPGSLNEGNTTYESGAGATITTPTYFLWEEGLYQGTSGNSDWAGTGLVSTNTQLGSFAFGGEVTSYYLRFDPSGQAGGAQTVTNASITFDKRIIGVFVTGTSQANSDAAFAPTGLTYGDFVGGNQRGMELNGAGTSDRFTISANGLTLNIVFSQAGGQNVDSLRVLINPEPGTLALFGLGLLGLGSLVGRRRRRKSIRTAA